MTSPARELFRSKDGRNYTLWIDIHDVIDPLLFAYWSKSVEGRRERGWMFRGQANADWDLIPSLYRVPLNDEIISKRQKYTKSFMNDFKKNSPQLGVSNLTEIKLLAIAQHYGFYTHLLDFTRNIEVAAYFATNQKSQARIGVIFGYQIKEYEEMRNPFKCWGSTQEETEKLMKDHGLEPLPASQIVEFDDIPRIYKQEGIFIECPLKKTETLLSNCIDRFYFHQKNGVVYHGQFKYQEWQLPSQDDFCSKEEYEIFLEMVRRSHPDVFEKTPHLKEADLFPPTDPISQFVEKWKIRNPDPTLNITSKNSFSISMEEPLKECPESKILTNSFSGMVDNFYFSKRRSPYLPQYLLKGRQLIESLCQYENLDTVENQCWLLWELFQYILGGKGYTCTIKLENQGSKREMGAFYFYILDRWLSRTYRLRLSREQAQQGFWHVKFDSIETTNKDYADLKKVDQRFLLRKVPISNPGINPYNGDRETRDILNTIKERTEVFNEGEMGSFLYDLHCIFLTNIGRSLEVIVGIGPSDLCCLNSPLVAIPHARGERHIIFEIYDGFFQCLKYTSVCPEHWFYYCEGDVDFMDERAETLLGLA